MNSYIKISSKLEVVNSTLRNGTNNQPRSNIKLAGYFEFGLHKLNAQLYTDIQPTRCWKFNFIQWGE